jgi:hypothetical protein
MSKRGCMGPFITSIRPDCVARSVRGRCLRNAPVSVTAALSPDTKKIRFGLHVKIAVAGEGICMPELPPLFHIEPHRLEGRVEHSGICGE